MSSKPPVADPSSYFLNLSSKLNGSKRPSAGSGPPPQPVPASTSRGATAGASALLTQVTQENGNGGGGASSSKQKPKVPAVALIERSRIIRSQPKNTSPIEASRHPSLLSPPMPNMMGKKTLILDVDETLVHSSYQPTNHYDLHLPLNVNGTVCNIYVAFRPYIAEFFRAISPLFEIVIFTASVSMYCDPLMNAVDKDRHLGTLRLFREHCSLVNGNYVKDLSLLGRNLENVAIIDNSPVAYLFQQRNAIPITSWFDDQSDEELLHLIPVLQGLARSNSVYDVLDNYNALIQLQSEIMRRDADL